MMFSLSREDAYASRMLQLGHAPRGPREHLLRAGTAQPQVRQYRPTQGGLAPSLLPTPLGCPPAQGGLACSLAWLYGPSAVGDTDHLARAPLVQLGHEPLRLLRAQVPPACTPHHRAGTAVPQAPAWARHPGGLPAPGAREAGHPRALILLVRPRPHQGCERLRCARLILTSRASSPQTV
jgi:hypothetical protein